MQCGSAAFQLAAIARFTSGAGVIEAWAAGSSWSDIMKDSSLDDGDIARLLSRTVDLLRHARFCDGLLVNTQIAARKAMKAMNRNPIADLVQ